MKHHSTGILVYLLGTDIAESWFSLTPLGHLVHAVLTGWYSIVQHCFSLKEFEVTEHRKVFHLYYQQIYQLDHPSNRKRKHRKICLEGWSTFCKGSLLSASGVKLATPSRGQTGSQTHLEDRVRFWNLYTRTDGYQLARTTWLIYYLLLILWFFGVEGLILEKDPIASCGRPVPLRTLSIRPMALF